MTDRADSPCSGAAADSGASVTPDLQHGEIGSDRASTHGSVRGVSETQISASNREIHTPMCIRKSSARVNESPYARSNLRQSFLPSSHAGESKGISLPGTRRVLGSCSRVLGGCAEAASEGARANVVSLNSRGKESTAQGAVEEEGWGCSDRMNY